MTIAQLLSIVTIGELSWLLSFINIFIILTYSSTRVQPSGTQISVHTKTLLDKKLLKINRNSFFLYILQNVFFIQLSQISES